MSEKSAVQMNITADADGKAQVLFGSAFHELTDKTVSEFETDSLNDFIA